MERDKFWDDVQKKIHEELRTKRPKDVDPRIFSMNEQIGYASSVLRRHDDIFFATMNFMFSTLPRKMFELNMANENVYTLKMENLKLKKMSEEERKVLKKHAEQNMAADRAAYEKDRLDFDRLMESMCCTKDDLSKTDFHFEVTRLIQTMKPDPTLFEHVDTFLKKLEDPEETIRLRQHQEKMQEQMESLKRDFAIDLELADANYKRSIKECNDRYEKVKALCDETMSKMKDKDRQIMELKISRDLKNHQLSKANREAAKIDGMVFINENFPHVFNSLIYRDCVISVINNRLCVLEKRQMDDHIQYLTIIRDIKLDMVRKYDSGNTALISKINNEHMQHLENTKSMFHTFVQTQILKDECARNEKWLMEVRKTFYLNEGDLKTFAAKVPKTINRRIFGEIKDDSIEARMFDVQAWAKECLRFKQLNDLLIREKSNLVKEISELKFQIWDKDYMIADLKYRITIMQATSNERFQSIEQHASMIVDWLKMKLALNQQVEGSELVEENGKTLTPLEKARMEYIHCESCLKTAAAAEIAHMKSRRAQGLPAIDSEDTDRLALLAIPLAQCQAAKKALIGIVNQEIKVNTDTVYKTNWDFKQAVEDRITLEKDKEIRELKENLEEVSGKLENCEKELKKKNEHIDIVEAIYINNRYGGPRVQVSAGRM
ncbi:Protein CBG26816 [Caenorhabditis briggsae]|uniref:Protein CBG26816 n=1 Tax=Caenorhabditis briggsae TaxID=6238 RepID=B6IJT5_CAEBR|nr:Protein CBG26816 [Caenorhabditis briggsae]CAS00165.1 Protein CBG26816 [Caenorhabditis briggsae]